MLFLWLKHEDMNDFVKNRHMKTPIFVKNTLTRNAICREARGRDADMMVGSAKE